MKVNLLQLSLGLALLTTWSVNASDSKSSQKVTQSTPETTTSASDKTAIVVEAENKTPSLKRKEENKEVHKRGIHFNGASYAAHGIHAAPTATLWPARSYAAQYEYSLQLPGASTTFAAGLPSLSAVQAHHSPQLLRHPAAFGYAQHQHQYHHQHVQPHYKTLVAHGSPATFPAYGAVPAIPAAAPVSLAVPVSVPQYQHAAPVGPNYILRPGGAVISSYSVNYPHYHKKPVFNVPVHTPVQQLTPVQPVHHVQPVAPIAPVQPVWSFATPVQTTFVHKPQPIPAVPIAPAQPAPQPVPEIIPSFPVQPSFSIQPAAPPSIPAFPAPPAFPSSPAFPSIPVFPSAPAFPSPPAIPAIPNIPPRPAQPPVLVGVPIQPQPPTSVGTQFPGNSPVPAAPINPPDSGSAEASPQIPPPQQPVPELPQPQPAPSDGWKPLYYLPPSPTSPPPSVNPSTNGNRPSVTLLPPYGSSPAEGYLPPASSSYHQNSYQHSQQQKSQGSNIFDHLSDAEIEHIFAQATVAYQQQQQQDQEHHHHHHSYHHH